MASVDYQETGLKTPFSVAGFLQNTGFKVKLLEIAELSYRVQASQRLNKFLTNGVKRVRLYASPAFRIASACVGYG